MPNTYSQVYLQVVFAVKGRQNLLAKQFRPEVFAYMSGIVERKGCKSIIINGMADHAHLFIGLKPAISISDLVRDVKNNSSNFINKAKFVAQRFSWQDGFGVFSYSRTHIDRVYKYIQHQEQHHSKRTFREEYLDFLAKFEVPYEEQYLFEFYDVPVDF